MEAPSVFCVTWRYVFSFLSIHDLIRVATICIPWWNLVFGRRCVLHRRRRELQYEDLDFSSMTTGYIRIPTYIFASSLLSLSIKNTAITTKHFLQIVRYARMLECLDISLCPRIDEMAIFVAKEKDYITSLTEINISNNQQFTVLSVACLSSITGMERIVAVGLKLTQKHKRFLMATFDAVASGAMRIETVAEEDE